MYKPGETAEILQIADSTLRKYSRHFASHFSQHAQRQPRRFTEKDVFLLQHICKLRDQGYLLKDIDNQLSQLDLEGVPAADEGENDEFPGIQVFENTQIQLDLNTLKDGYQQLNEIIPRIESQLSLLVQQIQILQDRAVQMENEIDNLKETISSLRTGKGNQPGISDHEAEMMQLKAELHRMKESQKRIDEIVQQFKDQKDSPWWRRG
jgi:DNA-binding transcriptional MerR regulator